MTNNGTNKNHRYLKAEFDTGCFSFQLSELQHNLKSHLASKYLRYIFHKNQTKPRSSLTRLNPVAVSLFTTMSSTPMEDRPIALLACICFLRINTGISYSRISSILERNFPEYTSLSAHLIQKIYDDVEELHQTWLSGFHHAERSSVEIQRILTQVLQGAYNNPTRFPQDTNDTRTMLVWLENRINTPDGETQRWDWVQRVMLQRARRVRSLDVIQSTLSLAEETTRISGRVFRALSLD